MSNPRCAESISRSPEKRKARHAGVPCPPPGETIRDTLPDTGRRPARLSQRALDEYVRHYSKTGFGTPRAHYRCRDLNWELTAAWAGQQILQPSMFLGGAADPALPLMQGLYETLEATYPNLHSKRLLEGVGHGAPEEAPEAVNAELLNWLKHL